MALYVKKFGGTSVGSIERIEAVAERVINATKLGHKVVVVLSAMSGETNRLLSLAKQIDNTPNQRELDVVLSAGEQVSVGLLAIALLKRRTPAISFLADQLEIRTDSAFGSARIVSINTDRITNEIDRGQVCIIAGFQGRDQSNNITTLGRGGTDTSAVEIAAALGANECHIYTDVDGVYTADPRVEPEARKLPQVYLPEMLELSSLGSKVLQKRAVEAAAVHKMPLRVLSSFSDQLGTLLSFENSMTNQSGITGIAHSIEQVMIKVCGVPKQAAGIANIISLLGENGIELDMLSQSYTDVSKIDYAFTVDEQDHLQAVDILTKHCDKLGTQAIFCNTEVVKVSAVGIGLQSYPLTLSRLFSSLAEKGIDVLLVSSSEISLSVLVEKPQYKNAVSTFHCAIDTESRA